MKRGYVIGPTLTLAVALLVGLGFSPARNDAWAQSARDLAGLWFSET